MSKVILKVSLALMIVCLVALILLNFKLTRAIDDLHQTLSSMLGDEVSGTEVVDS